MSARHTSDICSEEALGGDYQALVGQGEPTGEHSAPNTSYSGPENSVGGAGRLELATSSGCPRPPRQCVDGMEGKSGAEAEPRPANLVPLLINQASTADFPAPGTVLQTPDLPDAETKWRDLQPLVAFWMACSTVSFLSSLFWLPLGCLSGFLGIMGAFLMCNCQMCFNFAMAVKAMQTLASICMVLSGSVALVLVYTAIVIHCDRTQYSAKYCFRLVSTLSLLVVWHALHAVVSSAVSIRSSTIKKLLDPIKSGVILLPAGDSRRAQAGVGSQC
ncbi:g3576 [Coccomyxa elongata]